MYFILTVNCAWERSIPRFVPQKALTFLMDECAEALKYKKMMFQDQTSSAFGNIDTRGRLCHEAA